MFFDHRKNPLKPFEDQASIVSLYMCSSLHSGKNQSKQGKKWLGTKGWTVMVWKCCSGENLCKFTWVKFNFCDLIDELPLGLTLDVLH